MLLIAAFPRFPLGVPLVPAISKGMNLSSAALLAVSHAPALDRMRQIPTEFWSKVGLGILIVVAAVIVLRKVAKVNPVVLSIGLLIAGTTIGFNWIHERNEPKWATPAVQIIAGFFPGKVRA